jgi:predicted secreted protein
MKHGPRLTPLRLISLGLIFLVLKACTMPAKTSANEIICFNKEDSGKTFQVPVGQVVQIVLPANPSTGFRWHLVELSEQSLHLLELRSEPLSAGKRKGASILMIWRLKVKKPGRSRIVMACYRAWEEADKAVDSYSLTLEAGMQQ